MRIPGDHSTTDWQSKAKKASSAPKFSLHELQMIGIGAEWMDGLATQNPDTYVPFGYVIPDYALFPVNTPYITES